MLMWKIYHDLIVGSSIQCISYQLSSVSYIREFFYILCQFTKCLRGVCVPLEDPYNDCDDSDYLESFINDSGGT